MDLRVLGKREVESTVLHTADLTLVPYSADMVEKYHSWFNDSHLCDMTSMEGFSLTDAELAHHAWTTDLDKFMFIVLDNELLKETRDTKKAMIGDANVVLNNLHKDSPNPSSDPVTAEVMLMIADPTFRGRGLGQQILLAIMLYAVEKYQVALFEARIKQTNKPSIKMFLKIGFKTITSNDVFGELILNYIVDDLAKKELTEAAYSFKYDYEFITPSQKIFCRI